MYEQYRYRGPAERAFLLRSHREEAFTAAAAAGCACGGVPERSGRRCEWCEAARWQAQYDTHWAGWTPEQLSLLEAEVREAQMEVYQV